MNKKTKLLPILFLAGSLALKGCGDKIETITESCTQHHYDDTCINCEPICDNTTAIDCVQTTKTKNLTFKSGLDNECVTNHGAVNSAHVNAAKTAYDDAILNAWRSRDGNLHRGNFDSVLEIGPNDYYRMSGPNSSFFAPCFKNSDRQVAEAAATQNINTAHGL